MQYYSVFYMDLVERRRYSSQGTSKTLSRNSLYIHLKSFSIKRDIYSENIIEALGASRV